MGVGGRRNRSGRDGWIMSGWGGGEVDGSPGGGGKGGG